MALRLAVFISSGSSLRFGYMTTALATVMGRLFERWNACIAVIVVV
jgi:hypothetical protein